MFSVTLVSMQTGLLPFKMVLINWEIPYLRVTPPHTHTRTHAHALPFGTRCAVGFKAVRKTSVIWNADITFGIKICRFDYKTRELAHTKLKYSLLECTHVDCLRLFLSFDH